MCKKCTHRHKQTHINNTKCGYKLKHNSVKLRLKAMLKYRLFGVFDFDLIISGGPSFLVFFFFGFPFHAGYVSANSVVVPHVLLYYYFFSSFFFVVVGLFLVYMHQVQLYNWTELLLSLVRKYWWFCRSTI